MERAEADSALDIQECRGTQICECGGEPGPCPCRSMQPFFWERLPAAFQHNLSLVGLSPRWEVHTQRFCAKRGGRR